jgi:hypothetical protein
MAITSTGIPNHVANPTLRADLHVVGCGFPWMVPTTQILEYDLGTPRIKKHWHVCKASHARISSHRIDHRCESVTTMELASVVKPRRKE